MLFISDQRRTRQGRERDSTHDRIEPVGKMGWGSRYFQIFSQIQ